MPDAPAAPSLTGITRNLDSSHTLSWTRNASYDRPYDRMVVQRRAYANGWGPWISVKEIKANYTNSGGHSFTNTGLSADTIYEWRVVAYNSAGSATSGVYRSMNSPGQPGHVNATRQSSGSIKVTWNNNVWYSQYKTRLAYSSNGGSTWNNLASVASGVTSYTWASPPSESVVQVRVQAYNNDPGTTGSGVSSAWAYSDEIQLPTTPNPPSNLSPTGSVFSEDTAQLFTWQHNPIDSSEQVAYELEVTDVTAGSTVSTGKVLSGDSQRSYPSGSFINGHQYTWRARTWGVFADPSGWSSSASFTVSGVPLVSISSPEDSTVLGVSQVSVAWEYFDDGGTAQSAWEANLILGDAVIESRSGSGATSSVDFTTPLLDATTYTVRVRVRNGFSLWSSWTPVSFSTDFPSPPVPFVSGVWDPEFGSVNFDIMNPAPTAGLVEAVSNRIQRSDDGGVTWVDVETRRNYAKRPSGSAAALYWGSTLISDPIAPLNQDVLYRVIAVSDIPSYSEPAEITVTTTTTRGYWNFGDGMSGVVALAYGRGNPPKIDLTVGLAQKTLHYFAGRTRPVEFAGDAKARTGAVEFLVLTLNERLKVETGAVAPAPHLFRMPDGLTLYASIGDVAIKRVRAEAYTISMSITEVDR